MPRLTASDLAGLFGTTAEDVERHAGEMMRSLDLSYEVVEGAPRDAILIDVLKRIHGPALPAAGSHRADAWESGWRENLEEFRRSRDAKALVPKYVKPGVPIRLNGAYIRPALDQFVYHYTQLFRACLFQNYLAPFDHVIEFGCGTGQNLVHLGQLFPGKRLTGCDWARSSQELLAEIRTHLGFDITGHRFDFFAPDPAVPLDRDAAVLTFGALEQLGDRHQPYLEFVLARRPALCIDVVGLDELYDGGDLVDYLGLLYHWRRNYLNGYLAKLREREAAGALSIVQTHHQRFGNYFDDPYSYVVWRPR